jgi:PTS system nitrogen regulatory IIA component
VRLLIFLLVPEAATQKHLEILSEIAELLSDSGLRERMKPSTDAAGLHALIAQWQSAQPERDVLSRVARPPAPP